MKNLKKTLAALFALTMAFGMVSCGEDSSSSTADSSSSAAVSSDAGSADDSSESSADADSSDASSAESSDDSSAASAPNGAYASMEHRTLEHEPYAISAEYDLPVLDGLTMNDDSNGTTYFGILSKTSYIYRKEGDMLGVDVYPQLKLIVKERAKQVYENDDFITQTSDNGNQIAYKDITIKNEGTDKAQWEATLFIYGGSYRECNVFLEIHTLADQTKMTKEEFETFILTVANSAKFNVENENALILDDGSFKVYSHRIIVPPTVSIAGTDCEAKLIFSQIYPEAFVTFADGGIKYEMNTDILSQDNRTWERTQEKTDEYTAVKVAGYDAYAKLASFGLSADFVIKLGDDHVETVKIYGKSFDDGSGSKDGKSFTDVHKEMTDDAHKADTIKLLTGYVSDFVSTWTLDEE
ncbi:MAG: hypothetical protein IKQ39_05175 [Oscillospiraceae bacterium]|nr:hypothetical protein [Oscillospiraceae bacterium]